MQKSESIGSLAAALAKAQGEFRQPKKNRTVKVTTKTGGSYTFDYATLDEILDCVRKPLADASLALIQVPTLDEYRVVVETTLVHGSGEFISESIGCKPDEMKAQAIGSIITYLRRYAIVAILGLSADEDDDANKGMGNDADARPRSGKKQRPEPQLSRPTEPAPATNGAPEPLPDFFALGLKAARSASGDKLKELPAKIEVKPLALHEKAILKGYCIIRQKQLELGGTDAEPMVSQAARHAAMAVSGMQLDWVLAAIEHDERLSFEEKDRARQAAADRTKQLEKAGAA